MSATDTVAKTPETWGRRRLPVISRIPDNQGVFHPLILDRPNAWLWVRSREGERGRERVVANPNAKRLLMYQMFHNCVSALLI